MQYVIYTVCYACNMYSIITTIVQGIWPDYEATSKIHKNLIMIRISSKFLHNLRTCICIRKNYKNGEFSPSHF